MSDSTVDDNKLWRLGGGVGVRARPRRECITKAEAKVKAAEIHAEGGHFHRDSIKLAMMDKFHSPKMDESIVSAITDCARCKGFGPAHLHSLMNPTIRRHPFELVAGDYLSMPMGVSVYHNIGMYIDTCSQNIWGFMYKEHGSANTTEEALEFICDNFMEMETFMVDNGPHFKNKAVEAFCDKRGIKFHCVSAYSPWINGLVEGANRLIINVLARLCTPDVGEDAWRATTKDNLPKNWPKFFKQAIRILNNRLLPSIKFRPKEILMGRVVNTPITPIERAVTEFSEADALVHMDYVEQQRLDAYDGRVAYAAGRKAAFDRKVLGSRAGEVIFKPGELVQVFRSDLAKTVSNDRKLTCRWSEPHRIAQRWVTSYLLETTEGLQMDDTFSSRRLRHYHPREGTPLAIAQAEFTKRIAELEGAKGTEEAEAVAKLRAAEVAEAERWQAEEVGSGLEEDAEE
jgi:transposase InsO family protein